jgi:hypothetical protein
MGVIEAGRSRVAVPAVGVAALVIVAAVIAVVLRARPLVLDFPLGDGGLFWVMANDLVGNGFLPPSAATYNDAGIPWMYPPLGLYFVALLGGGIEWFRVVPVVFTVATLPALWLLARALANDRAAIVSLVAYGLATPAYLGLVAGGGVTRAPGVVLALLTMWAVVRGHAITAGGLGGLVILTHPTAAVYGALGSAVLWATRGAPSRMLVAPVIALGIGAIWFVPMVVAHGIGSLTASLGSRGTDLLDNVVVLLSAILHPPNLAFTIGAVGMVIAIVRRRWDLIGLVVVSLLGASVVDRWAVIPFAILAGMAVDAAIGELPRARSVALLAVAGVVTVTGVVLSSGLQPLTADERAVMDWARTETEPEATFAVVGYPADLGMVEWFPAISERRNVTAWQGTEWVAGGFRREEASAAADCRSPDCLPDADYYVLRPGCCPDIVAGLEPVRPFVYQQAHP